MPRVHVSLRSALLAVTALAVTLFASCARDAAAPADLRIQAAVGATRATISVTSTDPSLTRRDTTINVRVIGAGFTAGAKVSFAIRGVVSSKMVVNSTSYISSTELLANVTIKPDADTTKYDVITLMADGKKGIGSELFEVVTKDFTPTWYVPVNDATLNLRGDGNYVVNGSSAYAHNVCGMSTRIFYYPSEGSGSGDATAQSTNPKFKSGTKTCPYPRTFTWLYPDGSKESAPFFVNLHELAHLGLDIPIGATTTRAMNVQSGVRCNTIRFRAEKADGTYVGGDSLLVTRVDAQTFTVASQPAPHNKAYCDNTGELLNLNVRITLVSRDPLP